STQAAIDNKANTFSSTGGTTLTDLSNSASFKADGYQVSMGAGTAKGGSAGVGKDSGQASSTTVAGISGVAGNSAARTGDKESGIKKIFDADKVSKEVNAQVAITSEFGKGASKAVGDYAQKQYDKALASGDQAGIDAWKEGGTSRVALHAVVGGLTGGAQGALGAASVSAAAPSMDALQTQLAQSLQTAGLSESASNAIASMATGAAAAGVGALASGGSALGAASAFNSDVNNRQLSLPERQKAAQLAKKSAGKYTQKQIEDALRNASDSATGENITTGKVIKNPADPKAITDKGAVFDVGGDGKSLVQELPNGGDVDPELAGFIQKNAPNYSWSN
ncbi:MAG: hypothetical protein ACOVKF_03660, partial [Limnohabitans sp.]